MDLFFVPFVFVKLGHTIIHLLVQSFKLAFRTYEYMRTRASAPIARVKRRATRIPRHRNSMWGSTVSAQQQEDTCFFSSSFFQNTWTLNTLHLTLYTLPWTRAHLDTWTRGRVDARTLDAGGGEVEVGG